MNPQDRNYLPGLSTAESGRFTSPNNPYRKPVRRQTVDLSQYKSSPEALEEIERIKAQLRGDSPTQPKK